MLNILSNKIRSVLKGRRNSPTHTTFQMNLIQAWVHEAFFLLIAVLLFSSISLFLLFFFLFLSFFFFPFDGSISFESSWHQEIKLLKAECVPRIGRIFIVAFYCGTGGSNSPDPLQFCQLGTPARQSRTELVIVCSTASRPCCPKQVP